MHRKELFYYVTSGSNVMRDVHWCVTVDYQQIGNGNIANQIHGFTIDYGKFILIVVIFWSDLPVKQCEGDRTWLSQLFSFVLNTVCENLEIWEITCDIFILNLVCHFV